MRALVAWRVLTHEVARSLLAVLGVFAAVVLVFLQLGFYSSVPVASTLIYNALKFDIVLTSRDYAFQVRPHHFPRRRLYQALMLPEVETAVPFYENFGRWLNAEGRLQREVFIMAADPDKDVFGAPSINAQTGKLKMPDTVIVDSATKPVFGPHDAGSIVEINGRKVEVVGSYDLGIGFLGIGAVVTSDLNFSRLYPQQPLDNVQVGLIRLRPGANADAVVEKLRAVLPDDVRILTRAAFFNNERGYWLNATSTGIVFGFGAAVAALIGGAVLFQTLSTLIMRNLSEYAVLKAIGYGDRYLSEIIIAQAMLIVLAASVPAVATAYGLYDLTRWATNLPVFMTGTRIVSVVFAALAAAVIGGMATSRVLKHADPADLF
jgi:putative ABC transport system permease protein